MQKQIIGFTDEADIEQQFQVGENYFKANKINILFAQYNQDGYEGDAHILFKQGRKLFEVHGSHCSCYGLEGQWSPEQTSVKELRARINRTDWNSHYFAGAKDLLENLQKRKIGEISSDPQIVAQLKREMQQAKALGLTHAQLTTLVKNDNVLKLIYTWTKTGVISFGTFAKLLDWYQNGSVNV